MKLSYRKQYAKKRLIALGKNPLLNIYTRAFDNCFEMFDDTKVVKYLMKQAENNQLLKTGIKYTGAWEKWKLVALEGQI